MFNQILCRFITFSIQILTNVPVVSMYAQRCQLASTLRVHISVNAKKDTSSLALIRVLVTLLKTIGNKNNFSGVLFCTRADEGLIICFCHQIFFLFKSARNFLTALSMSSYDEYYNNFILEPFKIPNL